MRLHRARSPLRWLWVGTSALGLLGLAGVTGQTWVILAIPVVCLALLFAPPVGVFRHDENPAPQTGTRVVAREAAAFDGDPPSAGRMLLVLVNDGDVAAEGFRIRILVPCALWPRGTRGTLLSQLRVGQLGRHWFIESVYDDSSVTFRAGRPEEAGSVVCPAGTSLDLAELTLVNLEHFAGSDIEYQINGGTVRTVLGKIALPCSVS